MILDMAFPFKFSDSFAGCRPLYNSLLISSFQLHPITSVFNSFLDYDRSRVPKGLFPKGDYLRRFSGPDSPEAPETIIRDGKRI